MKCKGQTISNQVLVKNETASSDVSTLKSISFLYKYTSVYSKLNLKTYGYHSYCSRLLNECKKNGQ